MVIAPCANMLKTFGPIGSNFDLVIMRGATREVFHVKRLTCGLLCTLPFYTVPIRTLVTVQHTALRICHSPAELLRLEYNVAHVFIKTVPIYPIEGDQCHGVLARYRLPACFLEHVES